MEKALFHDRHGEFVRVDPTKVSHLEPNPDPRERTTIYFEGHTSEKPSFQGVSEPMEQVELVLEAARNA